MIEWKRLYAKPAGSLPGGVVTQWGVGAITVFILLCLTYWIFLEGGEPAEVAGLTEVATTAPRSFTQQMTARVDAETMRAETNKAAELRAARKPCATSGRSNNGKPNKPDLPPPTKRRPRRAESRHRATLHAGRMGTPGTLATRSRRAAQPFASQWSGRSDLPQAGRRYKRRATDR